jgi:hypothetical protein
MSTGTIVNRVNAGPVEWTVLLYIGAIDNGQEAVDEALLREIVGAAIMGTNADFVYQFATSDKTIRGAIRSDGHNELLSRGKPIDITKPEHLTEFVDWALRQFPSRYTALFLKDHGSGWKLHKTPLRRLDQKKNHQDLGGLGIFYNGDTDSYMSTAEVALAVQKTKATRVDIYGFDACDMGAVEVAYEIRKVADFMIATQAFDPSKGWPYARILDHLRNHPGPISPREASREVVRMAGTEFQLVALELDWMSQFWKASDALGVALTKNVEDVAPWLRQTFSRQLAVDALAFLEALETEPWLGGPAPHPSTTIPPLAKAARDALDHARTIKSGSASIYLPVSGSNDFASYGSVSFARSNHWTAFLSALNALLLQTPQTPGARGVPGSAPGQAPRASSQ